MSRVGRWTSFSRACHPARPHAHPGWRRGGWLGKRGPLVGFPGPKTVPCYPLRIGSSVCWPLGNLTHGKGARGACAAGGRGKPIRGFTASSPRCWAPGVPAAMPRPAP